SMFGGLRRPAAVTAVKRLSAALSVGWGPWRKQAAKRLRDAALKGRLKFYVVPASSRECKVCALACCEPENVVVPVVVPVKALMRLIEEYRGGFADRLVRCSVEMFDGDEKLFALLFGGLLVVRVSEFTQWHRSERSRGKWASQKSRLRTNHGRPRK